MINKSNQQMQNLKSSLLKITSGILVIINGLVSCNQNQKSSQNSQVTRTNVSDSSDKKIQLPIWTKFMPDSGAIKGVETILKDTSSSLIAGKPFIMITNVSNPTLTI